MSLTDEITPDIKPGDNFYRYVNARWQDDHPIPAEKAAVGVFSQLSDDNTERLKTLLEQPSADGEAANISLLKQYYKAAMDESAIETDTPLVVSSVLSDIKALQTPSDILSYIAEYHAKGGGLLWDTIVEPDDKDSGRYLLRFLQDGLGLPDRDYYLDDSQQFAPIRGKYRDFLASLFTLVKLDDATERANRVLAMETALAKASMSVTEQRDPDKMYNLYDAAELAKAFPDADWTSYNKLLGLSRDRPVNVSQPKFLAAVFELIATTPMADWQDYLTVHTLLPLLARLSNEFVELSFGFYGKVLQGTEKQEPRYRRIIRHLTDLMPEPTGQLFVESYFDEASKQAIYDLVDHLKTAIGARINRLEWMSDATKVKAMEKLATFLPLLGYPDKWLSYDGLKLADSYADNLMAVGAFEWRRVAGRIDQPVDRNEWLMSPALVNACYWPNVNSITFPAGILQPPFFDAGRDFAANYGGIGVVIGHEITHGFDDQGAQFDASGNLKSWWTEADQAAFDARADVLVKQFDAYVVEGQHVNGKLTLGENIADLGGLEVAYDALQTKLTEVGTSEAVDGFTPEQRFFIAYATTWRENIRPEMQLVSLVTNPHSPDHLRVNGIVPNCDAFYGAFDVRSSDELYLEPDKRVRIW